MLVEFTSLSIQRTFDTCQLRPDLREDADVGPVDHIRLEEFQERSVGVVTFEFAHALDILELLHHKRTVRVAFAVHESEHRVAFLPAILARQPPGRFGKEAHADEEQDGRHHLDTPRNPERGRAVDL